MSNSSISSSQNKMGTMPVTRLILNMSLPMMFSMFIQALYNIIDSIFVAKIAEDALTAVSLAFPIQNLMISFAVGTGVGVNALLSKKLGEKNQSEVNKSAMNGLFLSICTFISFVILGLLFLETYFYSQTSNPEIISYGLKYCKVVLYASIFIFLGIMSDRLLQSTGRTIYTMYSQLAGALTNIIFDPLLIFGIGFFPELGIYGAAIATVLGQAVSLSISRCASRRVSFLFSPLCFLPISITSATFFLTLSGLMPCSSLYRICISRRRLVSDIAPCIERVTVSAYIIT